MSGIQKILKGLKSLKTLEKSRNSWNVLKHFETSKKVSQPSSLVAFSAASLADLS